MARTTSRRAELLWAALETWDCSTCGEPMPFENHPCEDAPDCPERICTGCGEVLLVGWAVSGDRRTA
jgi:hypothetical protein